MEAMRAVLGATFAGSVDICAFVFGNLKRRDFMQDRTT